MRRFSEILLLMLQERQGGKPRQSSAFLMIRWNPKESSAVDTAWGNPKSLLLLLGYTRKLDYILPLLVYGGSSKVFAAVARRVMNFGPIHLPVTPMQRSVDVLVTCKFTKCCLVLDLYIVFLQRKLIE
jgi:hypothetical protein